MVTLLVDRSNCIFR